MGQNKHHNWLKTKITIGKNKCHIYLKTNVTISTYLTKFLMVLNHESVSFNKSKSNATVGKEKHNKGLMQMSYLVNTNVTIGNDKCQLFNIITISLP